MTRFAELDPAAWTLPDGLVDELQSPSLVVYLDRVRDNLRSVLGLLGGDPNRWRPHVKTTKIPRVWAELARCGLSNFKCATTREARVLLRVLDECGLHAPDVLVAYPHRGPNLRRLGEIAAAYPQARVSVLCEDPDLVPEIPARLSVFVDVNPGMNRTGVALATPEVVHAIARAAGERFRGLHFYDGHLHGADLAERERLAFEGYDRLLELVASLTALGHATREIVTSGTPIFTTSLRHAGLREVDGCAHRVSPGTVVFHDLRTEDENPDLDLRPAALVLARVVSWPTPGVVTCDAGSKSIAAEAGDPCAAALGRPGLVARTPNEEHLPFDVVEGPPPERGEALLLAPRHVCPTVNLADEAVLVRDGELVDIVSVEARAHEVRAPGPR